MSLFKRFLALISVIAVLAAQLCAVSVSAQESLTEETKTEVFSSVSTDYNDYLKSNPSDNGSGSYTARLEYDNTVNGTDVKLVLSGDTVSVKFNVETAGLYNIGLKFMPYGMYDRYSVALSIDGKLPFKEASEIEFYSAFKGAEIKQDAKGNDILSAATESTVLHSTLLRSASALYTEPYFYYFAAGEHTVSFEVKKGELAVNEIFIKEPEDVPSYQEYLQLNKANENNPSGNIMLEAENPALKSDQSVIAETDRSGPDTTHGDNEKNSPFQLKLNTLSGENFKYINQWVSYSFSVESAGFYQIALRVKQNLSDGLFTSRRILIDGSLPFEEAGKIEFAYNDSWYIKVLGDENPYLFWLDKGEHTLTVEVTAGVVAELNSELNSELSRLNGIYKQIFMVTGSSPDKYMDYDLKNQIPSLIGEFEEVCEMLKQSLEKFVEISGGRHGTGFSVIDSLVIQIEGFIENPDTIEDKISSFKDNVSAFGSWVISLNEQPLAIDSIEIFADGAEYYTEKSGFFANLGFQLKVFLGSFVIDYDDVSETEAEDLNIWVMNGREQAQVVKNLIENEFSPDTGVSAKISVVSTGLVEATLAGTGPDVALFVPETTAVFLGVRDVLCDLSEMQGYEDIAAKYQSELLVPYKYGGATYGLPLTYNFFALFYRTDIFEELGLSCPKTWDEFYNVASVLQNNMMDIGMPSAIFEALLFQNGGSYFSDDLTTCTIDSNEGVEAFRQMTEFYTSWSFPVDYNFYNRFRTGEMPMAVEYYAAYAELEYAAPDIKGLWDMAPIPVKSEENKSYLKGTGTSLVLFKDTENKDAAMQFIDWFTDANVQASYGKQVEMVLGVAGKYTPANKEALKFLGWSSSELEFLNSQFEVVKEVPVIPSSYYISRSFNNAFRKVVYQKANVRETLLLYVRDINKEITRKNKELKID